MTRKYLAALAAMAAGLTMTTGNAAEMPVISVDAGNKLGTVNRQVFGHNMEAADGRGIFDEPQNAVNFDKNGIKYGQGFWNPTTQTLNAEPLALMERIKAGMMRYPGGCLAHSFNWKKAVGPLAERGDWRFGLDEFIEMCRKMKVEPIITVTDYALPIEQLPQHAAELVEYLNAPATPEHPWAMKRKEWGHAEPYGVVWFELGNETDHGNHHITPRRQYTPAEYVKYFKTTAAAMRKVDPSIKLGAVTVPGYGADYDCAWNMAVYKEACPLADFVVVHFYGPGVDELKPAESLRASMAYGQQLEYRLGKYRELTKAGCGKELPLAVTEYNIGSTKNEPTFYRYSFIAGLLNADFMRLWINPANKIATANYWQVLNGYWGMANVNANGQISRKRATLAFYEMWGQHSGEIVVDAKVENSPKSDAPAGPGLEVSTGDTMKFAKHLAEAPLGVFRMDGFNDSGVKASVNGADGLTVDFNGRNKQFFAEFATLERPAATVVPAEAQFNYEISFEARFTPSGTVAPTLKMGLGLCDRRGWQATKSAIAVTGVEKTTAWQRFSARFMVKTDCPGAHVLFRAENVGTGLSGKVEIRGLKVNILSTNCFPAYPVLTTAATLSQDGKKLYVMVFNKSVDKAITAKVDLKGFQAVENAKVWQLSRDDYGAKDYMAPFETSSVVINNGVERTFPAHSMTAFEFNAK